MSRTLVRSPSSTSLRTSETPTKPAPAGHQYLFHVRHPRLRFSGNWAVQELGALRRRNPGPPTFHGEIPAPRTRRIPYSRPPERLVRGQGIV